jgi:hypothetical protein
MHDCEYVPIGTRMYSENTSRRVQRGVTVVVKRSLGKGDDDVYLISPFVHGYLHVLVVRDRRRTIHPRDHLEICPHEACRLAS